LEPDICYCAYHGREWWWSTNRVCFAPRQVVRGALGVLTTIIRTYCTCTLGDRCATARYGIIAKAEREFAQLSCWRTEAKPVGAPATGPPDRRQRHPARPGRGQPWIMDARCHALCTCRQAGCFSFLHRMHAFARQTRWPTPSTADLPATYREATAAPTNTTHVHVLSPPCSVRSMAF
jgi:hypothetical protein